MHSDFNINKANDFCKSILKYNSHTYREITNTILNIFSLTADGDRKILLLLLKMPTSRYLKLNLPITNISEDIKFEDVSSENTGIVANSIYYDLQDLNNWILEPQDINIVKLVRQIKSIESPQIFSDDYLKVGYSILSAKILISKYKKSLLVLMSQESEIELDTDIETSYYRRNLFPKAWILFSLKYLEEIDTDRNMITIFSDNMALIYYGNIWKSIAQGEFYKCDEYEKQIRTEEEIMAKLEEEDPNYLTSSMPDIIYRLDSVKDVIRDFCQIVDPRELHNDDCTIALEPAVYINTKALKSSLVNELLKITQLILKMTIVDIYYISTENNIKILGELFRSLSVLKKDVENKSVSLTKNNYLTEKLYQIERVSLFDTIELLLLKTSVLLSQLLEQKANGVPNEICFHHKINNETWKNVVFYNEMVINNESSKSKFANYYQSKGKEILKLDYHELSNLPKIRMYNKHISQSLSSYKGTKKYFDLLLNKEPTLENFKNVSEEFSQYIIQSAAQKMPPSLYIKVILWLDNYMSAQTDITNAITLQRKVLREFRKYIIKYDSEKDIPYLNRSYFEYSFYNKDGFWIELKDDVQEDLIFIASLHCNPLNPSFLNHFHLFYNNKLKDIVDRMIFNTGLEVEDALKSVKEDRKLLEIKLKKDRELLDKELKDVSNQLDRDRGKTLQLVGLLVAFIAFITTIIGTQSVVERFEEILVFLFVYLIGVIVFVICIQRVVVEVSKKGEPEANFWRHHSLYVIFITILILFLGSVCLWHNTDNDKKKKTPDTKVEIQNHIKTVNNNITEQDTTNISNDNF